MLKELIIGGRIPHLMWIKKILLVLALLLPFSIFFMPREFVDFGEIGWYVLVGVMVSRPLSELLPRVRILCSILAFRRESGIFAGMMMLAHFVGFLLIKELGVFDVFFTAKYWDFNKFFAWGMLGIVAIIPPLITSNDFSMSLLKGAWHWVQRFSYLIVLGAGIHIYMLGGTYGLIGIIIVAAMWIAGRTARIMRRRKKAAATNPDSTQ